MKRTVYEQMMDAIGYQIVLVNPQDEAGVRAALEADSDMGERMELRTSIYVLPGTALVMPWMES